MTWWGGRWTRYASPLVILVMWEIASRAGLANPYILPAPSRVFVDIYELIVSRELFSAVYASMVRVVSGFSIAIVVGVGLGVLMARFAVAENFIDPLVELVRPVSPLAILPLAILWFGIGDASKIFLIALSCTFPVLLNTYAGVRSIDVNFLRAARSLGADQAEVIQRVILPSSLPTILTGVRISWGIALIVIIASEMVGAINGLGFMVLDAQQTFKVERVFSGIFIIGAIGYATDRGLRWLRRVVTPWHAEYRS